MRRIASLCVAVLISGCTSLADIRERMPESSMVVASAAEPLSACVYDKLLLANTVFDLSASHDGNTPHVAEGYHRSGSYFWDVAFVPVSDQQTRIEVRYFPKKNIWGGDSSNTSDLMATIRKCGS